MIYLFLANGFEEVEALCPLDILRRAGLEVTTVSIGYGTGKEVIGTHGITVMADIAETAFDPHATPLEAVILPGGMPGARNLDASPVVDAALQAAAAAGAWLCAICAAPMVLGRRGLLSGLRATCYPGFENTLTGATGIGGKVVLDTLPASGNTPVRRCITAAGMGVAMEFGLEIVSVLTSPALAGEIRASVQAP